MVNDDPKNDNSQQADTVELIPLAPLVENPDPDFDVVVERRGRNFRSWFKRVADGVRPAPSTPNAGNPGDNAS